MPGLGRPAGRIGSMTLSLRLFGPPALIGCDGPVAGPAAHRHRLLCSARRGIAPWAASGCWATSGRRCRAPHAAPFLDASCSITAKSSRSGSTASVPGCWLGTGLRWSGWLEQRGSRSGARRGQALAPACGFRSFQQSVRDRAPGGRGGGGRPGQTGSWGTSLGFGSARWPRPRHQEGAVGTRPLREAKGGAGQPGGLWRSTSGSLRRRPRFSAGWRDAYAARQGLIELRGAAAPGRRRSPRRPCRTTISPPLPPP